MTLLLVALLAMPINAPLALATLAALSRPEREVATPEPRPLPTVAGRLILDPDVPTDRLVLRIDGIDGKVAPDGSFSFWIPQAGVHTLELWVDWDRADEPVARWSGLEFFDAQTLHLPDRDLRARIRGIRLAVVDGRGQPLAGKDLFYGRAPLLGSWRAQTNAAGCVVLATSRTALPEVWIFGGESHRDLRLREIDGDRRAVLLPRIRVRCVLDPSVPLPPGSRQLLPTITVEALRVDWNWRFPNTLLRLQQSFDHFGSDREVLLRLPSPGEYQVQLWVMNPTLWQPLANAYGVVEAVPGVEPASMVVPETEEEIRLVITLDDAGLRFLQGLGKGGR